ncbi:type II secretion system GspH family protein [Patescibacteria group bacterium]|nr:type II secretion system GspH family protein [Patescibacteria group bacterium]MCL5409931.1 type II secretion system GspH family protein [Patescibacteria group bacterium]
MKKLLPKTNSNPQGFTLFELLVVISILAILGIIGITIYTGTLNKARDAKRKADIEAMAGAMEANYVSGSGYPTSLNATWFSDQTVPTNPSPGGATYATSFNTSSGFVFCASLENSTGNATTSVGGGATTSGNWYCKRNAQ